MELPVDVCGWTSLHGIGTPGPVGKPPACARPTSVAYPPGTSAAKDGFGPDGRKKLKTAGVPMNPTGAPVQLPVLNPWPRIPGATIKMLPLGSGTHVFGAALGGTLTKSGLLPGACRPMAMAFASLETSKPGFVTLVLIVRSRCTPCVKL